MYGRAKLSELTQRSEKMMPRPCCHRAALSLDAGFCDECGTPLLRCAAYEECGGLVDEGGVCPVCVAPRLELTSQREAQVGGSMALPLLLENRARVGRPLFVRGAWTREGGNDWQPMELSFDRLDAGAGVPFTVRTEPLQRSGTHAVEIALALATRWRWREEVFAFATGVEIAVEAGGEVSVTQNITYDASAAQTGATIYAPLRLDARKREQTSPRGGTELLLARADRLERTLGLRGSQGTVIQREARLSWRGFARGHAPAEGPITTSDGSLVLGRSRTKMLGGSGDVRLLVQGADGELDEDASRSISRRHFSLSITGGRLLLHIESDLGAWIDGRHEPGGSIVELRDGSRFSPLPRSQAPLSLEVSWAAQYGSVEAIQLTRVPREGTSR